MSRIIFLDTETTGLSPKNGDRVVEIGCVELINRKLTRNNFHVYLNPQRHVPEEVIKIHGITNEFLADKPLFEEVADAFLTYIKGAELIMHNASFDVDFINNELHILQEQREALVPNLGQLCKITDSLKIAKQKHPGQRNNLDSLCRRYFIDNSKRDLHGALLDAELLADVYLAMTGGQASLDWLNQSQSDKTNNLDTVSPSGTQNNEKSTQLKQASSPELVTRKADEQELANHQAKLEAISKASGDTSLWQVLESESALAEADKGQNQA